MKFQQEKQFGRIQQEYNKSLLHIQVSQFWTQLAFIRDSRPISMDVESQINPFIYSESDSPPNSIFHLGEIHRSWDKTLAKRTRRTIPNFLKTLYDILNKKENWRMIRWEESGKEFKIADQQTFCETVLPNNFKKGNWLSFVRQMNIYSFKMRRTSYNSLIYSHPLFQEGASNYLMHMKRKPIKGPPAKKGKKVKKRRCSDYSSTQATDSSDLCLNNDQHTSYELDPEQFVTQIDKLEMHQANQLLIEKIYELEFAQLQLEARLSELSNKQNSEKNNRNNCENRKDRHFMDFLLLILNEYHLYRTTDNICLRAVNSQYFDFISVLIKNVNEKKVTDQIKNILDISKESEEIGFFQNMNECAFEAFISWLKIFLEDNYLEIPYIEKIFRILFCYIQSSHDELY